MQIYAHRGASQTYPENSLDAFAEAVRLAVDGIELDLHATADGVPVISHDASLKRALNLDIEIPETTFAELRERAPSVPTFAEVLELVGGRLHFDLEVKQAGIEAHVLRELANYPAARWAISCFDWIVLRAFRAIDPAIDLWLLGLFFSETLVATARDLGATAAALEARSITETTVRSVHDAGLDLMVWTVNDLDRARQLKAWGVDMLCTDAPHLFV